LNEPCCGSDAVKFVEHGLVDALAKLTVFKVDLRRLEVQAAAAR
jgi:hypothetical protein